MRCPKCGKEMEPGYFFSTRDGAFSFAREVPGVFENARNAPGFVKITEPEAGHRARVDACCCDGCRMVIGTY